MTSHVSISAGPRFQVCRRLPEPGQNGWRRFFYFLFIYLTFEGLLRRSVPLYNLEILLLKDAALLIFYTYYLLCVKPNLPRWRSKDRVLTLLVIAFIAVNAIGIVKAGRYGVIPVLIGLKANFWYVPIFFIGRRYFTSYRQIGAFWSRLVWLLIPVLCVGVWQVLFGQFAAATSPTTTVDAATWAAAGSGSLRNNTDGTLIATVASTFYGGRFAVFAAIWLLLMTVLCLTDQKKRSLLRIPYLYVGLACALVSIFISANRSAVGLSVVCATALVASAGARHSAKFLARVAVIAALVLMLTQAYRDSRRSEILEGKFHAFTSFFSGLLDTPGPDIRGSRYSVIGTDIVHGLELSLVEVGPFGRGLGLMTQGAVYIDAGAQTIFDVQKAKEAQADSQWVRLMIELGIPGLLLYLAIALWVLRRLVVEALRVRRQSWRDGLVATFAPALLFLYLGLAHKHAGFAVDPMFQCYLYFVTGSALGVASRGGSVKPT